MSLDIFDLKVGFWQTVVGLFMHNVPTLILLVVLLISWKYEIAGGIVFIAAGLAYIISLLLNSKFEWYMLSWSLMIAGPAFLIGILFLMNWFEKKKDKTASKLSRKKSRFQTQQKTLYTQTSNLPVCAIQ